MENTIKQDKEFSVTQLRRQKLELRMAIELHLRRLKDWAKRFQLVEYDLASAEFQVVLDATDTYERPSE